MPVQYDLRTMRQQMALTIGELATISGVDATCVWRTEVGRTVPRAKTRRRLAEALGVAPARICWPGVGGEPRCQRQHAQESEPMAAMSR